LDAEQSIYVGGVFAGAGDFDPTSGEYLLSADNGDRFLLKLSQPAEEAAAVAFASFSSDAYQESNALPNRESPVSSSVTTGDSPNPASPTNAVDASLTSTTSNHSSERMELLDIALADDDLLDGELLAPLFDVL
jgi:hypothetical protein